MKKFLLVSAGIAIAALTFTACKPSAPKPDAAPSIEKSTHEAKKKVENAMLAVPQDASVFAYYYPTPETAKFYFKSDAGYFNFYEKLGNIKGLSDAYDAMVEHFEKNGNSKAAVNFKKGEFKEWTKKFAVFALKFGAVAYSEKIDMAKPDSANFAAVLFMDTARLRDTLAEMEKSGDIPRENVLEVNTKSGTRKAYCVLPPDTDRPLRIVFLPEEGRLMIASTKDYMEAFAARLDSPSGPSVLDNPEYKKLRAEMKSPVAGVFADFKGFKLDMSDPSVAMGFGMANGMLGLDKMESFASFYENPEGDVLEGAFMFSAGEGALFYDIFKTKLPFANLLSTSPKGSDYAVSFAFPEAGGKVYSAIATAAMMSGGAAILQSPLFKLAKENVRQANIAAEDFFGMEDPSDMKLTGAVYINDIEKALSAPEIAGLVSVQEKDGLKTVTSPMLPETCSTLKLKDGVAFSTAMDAAGLSKLMDGKGESMADIGAFKKLSGIISKDAALVIYADYMKYMEAYSKAFGDIINASPSNDKAGTEFAVSLVKALTSTIREYKLATSIKSENLIIKGKFAYVVDIDMDAIVENLGKLDWQYLINEMKGEHPDGGAKAPAGN